MVHAESQLNKHQTSRTQGAYNAGISLNSCSPRTSSAWRWLQTCISRSLPSRRRSYHAVNRIMSTHLFTTNCRGANRRIAWPGYLCGWRSHPIHLPTRPTPPPPAIFPPTFQNPLSPILYAESPPPSPNQKKSLNFFHPSTSQLPVPSSFHLPTNLPPPPLPHSLR